MKRFVKTLAAIVATTIVFAACSNIMDDLKVRPAFQPEPTTTPTPAPEQTPTPTPAPVDPALSVPLTLEAAEAGAVVTFDNKAKGPVTYKVNGGEAQTIASGATGTITLAAIGDKVEFWGDNKTYATGYNNCSNIACSADCYVYGNIMSLIKSQGFENVTALEEGYNFFKLFENNASIKNKDGENLLLPATTLKEYCYAWMFNLCENLVNAPILPATTLADHCYNRMFSDCKKLANAPTLPATTLATGCYASMFCGCESITTAPNLPVTTLASGCYGNMFGKCKKLANAPELPANELTETCYEGMFQGCESLESAPALPATTLTNACYRHMFNGCSNLTAAPILNATTLADECYRSMFQGCAKLNSVTCLATDISASNCTKNWLSGVADSGTFTKAEGMTSWPTNSANGIPSGWTYNEDAPLAIPLTLEACVAGAVVTFVNKAAGPVTYKVNGGTAQTIASGATGKITLANIGAKVDFFGDNNAYATSPYNYSNIACDKDCYVYGNIMSLVQSDGFKDATELKQSYAFFSLFKSNAHIKNKDGADLLLPATTLADYCYSNMLCDCTSLTAAPSLPATTLARGCYNSMFSGCANLTAAPSLPATTLASHCYSYMFSGCTSLNSVTCLATDISASNCTTDWLKNVKSSGTFTKAAGMDWPTNDENTINGIPSGWTVVDKQ